MHRLRSWTASLVSRVDWMVSQFENHEALAQSAIREVQQAAARARVQLARVRQDGVRLQEQVAQAIEAERVWRERARSSASQDEARALECLRRSKRAARLAAELRNRAEQHQRAEKQLAQDVQAVDERLSQLKEKRNLLRTRQSRAEALSQVRGVGASVAEDIGELFDRWETRVTERELEGECALPGSSLTAEDAFAAEFEAAEETDALRQELAELVRNTGGRDDA